MPKFKVGDRVYAKRNIHAINVAQGEIGTVIAIDPSRPNEPVVRFERTMQPRDESAAFTKCNNLVPFRKAP